MWGPWAVVRGPSGTKRAAESGKACGITATATSDGETLIWRGRLATPQNPSLALTRLPPHGVTGKPPWRDAKGWHLDRVRYSLMPPSPPHSSHPYAVLTAFVAALLHKISIVTPVMDAHKFFLQLYWWILLKTEDCAILFHVIWRA